MRANTALPLALLIMLALGSAWGFATVMQKRYSSGDAYPVYSSLRTDPLGTRALLESLERLPTVSCERNYQRLEKLEGGPGSALLLLHVPPGQLENGRRLNGETLQTLVAGGMRVVLAVDGQSSALGRVFDKAEERRDENARAKTQKQLNNDKNEKADKPTKEEIKRDKEFAEEILFQKSKAINTVLGITVKEGKFTLLRDGGYELTPAKELTVSAEKLPLWYSKTRLEIAAPARNQWQVLAKVKDQVMLAERRIGSGSLIIATDSYFTSNEALWKEPAPEFLTWLLGDARQVLFDETHLGTHENPGIMTLARRYRLHGLFLGGIILFALFVWKSSSSLLPATDEETSTTHVISGHGATAALVSLLKRGIPRHQLLPKGLETWERQQKHPTPTQQQRLTQARALLDSIESKKLSPPMLLDLYQRLASVLHPNTRVHKSAA